MRSSGYYNTLSNCCLITVQVDYKNSSTKFLGWVVASYSFGQLIASPFFGTWADYRPTMEPLIVATVINIVFNVVYSYLGAFGSGVAGWMMIMSRSLVGFGAGLNFTDWADIFQPLLYVLN